MSVKQKSFVVDSSSLKLLMLSSTGLFMFSLTFKINTKFDEKLNFERRVSVFLFLMNFDFVMISVELVHRAKTRAPK